MMAWCFHQVITLLKANIQSQFSITVCNVYSLKVKDGKEQFISQVQLLQLRNCVGCVAL